MFAQIMEHFTYWRTYRETLHKLRMLDEHVLGDIGISRRDLAKVARRETRRATCL